MGIASLAGYWASPALPKSALPQLTTINDTPVSAYSVGTFDKLSIMKYYYDDWMFVAGKNSVCYSPNVNCDLSAKDKQLIAAYYPKAGAAAAALQEKHRLTGKKVGLVLSGGNIDFDLFRSWVVGPMEDRR